MEGEEKTIKCSCGKDVTYTVRKGLCVPFVFCKACGTRLETGEVCE